MNKKRAGGSPTDSFENRPPPNEDACGTRSLEALKILRVGVHCACPTILDHLMKLCEEENKY